jgi:hypothetical protein
VRSRRCMVSEGDVLRFKNFFKNFWKFLTDENVYSHVFVPDLLQRICELSRLVDMLEIYLYQTLLVAWGKPLTDCSVTIHQRPTPNYR